MPKIKSINCHKIINSRGDWTIMTSVELSDGSIGEQSIPDGASKGENEAIYINPEKSVEIVTTVINDALKNENPFEQAVLDKMLIEMDGTPNKRHLGGNSILSVSLAVAKASAISLGIELYQYLYNLYNQKDLAYKHSQFTFPTPVFNIINGGKHAHNNLSFQEFMIIPATSLKIDKSIEIGMNVYHSLQKILLDKGYEVGVGDEGGFAPDGFTVNKALDFIRAAVSQSYKPGVDVFFGMDVAAESFYKNKKYTISEEHLELSHEQLGEYYQKLIKEYELIYLEDPFHEKDLQAWQDFYAKNNKKLMIVGDDLVVTNPQFLNKVISSGMINAAIVKPNQVGTLTETLEFVKTAKNAGFNICVSHRSGDTAEDTFISDLAVAVGAEFMKSGAPVRGERVAKYNRLLEIYDKLK